MFDPVPAEALPAPAGEVEVPVDAVRQRVAGGRAGAGAVVG